MGEGIQQSAYGESLTDLIRELAVHDMREVGGRDLASVRDLVLPGVRGSFRAYGADKIDKIAISDFTVGDVRYGLCTVFPAEDYDLPIFFSAWKESEKEITFLVDLMPAVDFLVDEGYRKKYLESIEPLWDKFAGLPGIRPEENDTIRSLCSIVYTAAVVPIEREGMRLALLAPHTEYLKSYIGFVKDAAAGMSDTKRKEVVRKRAAIRATLRAQHEELFKGAMGYGVDSALRELMMDVLF